MTKSIGKCPMKTTKTGEEVNELERFNYVLTS